MHKIILQLSEKAAKFVSKRAKAIFICLYGNYLKRSADTRNIPPKQYGWTKISSEVVESEFDYKDESWNEIRFIHARICLEWWGISNLPMPDNTCKNTRVKFSGDSLSVESMENSSLRWVMLRFKNKPGPVFAIEHDVTIYTDFSELQFAFNYRSIADRVRFMLVDNRELVFQTVEKGAFIAPLQSKPIRLEHGRRYVVRVEVIGGAFTYSIDGTIVMSINLPSHRALADDSIALILFEKDPTRAIRAKIGRLSIYRGSQMQ